MLSDTGRTDSLWMVSSPPKVFPPMAGDIRTDVCVIGAGIAGVTTAYLLAQAGRRVVVLEDGAVGGGETGRTTAHLSNALDDRYHILERVHGLDGYLFLSPGQSPDLLDAELEAAHRAGLTAVGRLGRAPLPGWDTGPCLRFPDQGQFHPLAYMNGLVSGIERMGGQLFGKTHVTGVEAGSPSTVSTTNRRTVTADFVVCATNTPIVDWVVIHSKQAAYRTFAIAGRVPPGSVPSALYWDTADPYHYVRLAGDVLIVGGEDHKTGQRDDGSDRFRKLEEWARERFPIGEIEFRWSGQVMEPVDGLGYIGRNPGQQQIFVATGDSGHGMTHGTIAGILIRDLILGRGSVWDELYNPGRKSVRSTVEYVRENLNVARQYVDYVTPGEVGSEEEIRPGEGAVIRRGIKKLAVYRDDSGALHRASAVCPHLGCIVQWNSLERSWDCPCHGSRFGVDGSVLNGPAARGLDQYIAG